MLQSRNSFRSVFCGALFALCLTAPGHATEPATTDRLVRQWLALEHQASALTTDWLARKPSLEQRRDLLTAEKAQLQRMLAENKDGGSDVSARRAELLQQQNAMEAEQQVLEGALVQLEARLAEMTAQLPPPLRSLWADEQAALSDTSTSTERLQAVLAQLAKFTDFDGRITLHEAAITAPTGGKILVKQLYLGAGAAWFVSADQSYYGTGGPGPEGWQWSFAADGVESVAIAKSIAIFERQRKAEIVQLPYQAASGAGQ